MIWLIPALLLLFMAGPIIELALLLEIGRRIGTIPTLLIVLGTGALGSHAGESHRDSRSFARFNTNSRKPACPALRCSMDC